MVEIKQNLVSKDMYDIKCPYELNYKTITVHNTENDAPAENEVKYMITNTNKISFHYAVDDKVIIQGIPEDRNAWHAGDGAEGDGNRTSLSIEICYSKSGGEVFIQAEKNAAEFIASKLFEKKWDISKVKRHKDWSGKECPRKTMELGWDRFLKMIEDNLILLTNTNNAKNTEAFNETKKIITTTNKTFKVAKKSKPQKVIIKINSVRKNTKSLQMALNASYKTKLTIDGIRGPKTNEVLKKYVLRNYTQNDYARWVQQRLKDEGYDIEVDGQYGTGTTLIIKAFQKKSGLKEDGMCGYYTACKLIAL